MRHPVVLLLIALWTGLPSVSKAEVAQIAVPISTLPVTIRRPGIYTLKRDLNFKSASGAAITIASDNVVLDLGGRTITNMLPATITAPTASKGVVCNGVTGLTVRNGRISGFLFGVDLAAASRTGVVKIDNLQVDQCTQVGISISDGDGVEVRNCRLRDIGSETAVTNTWGMVLSGATIAVSGNEVFNIQGGTISGRAIQVSPTTAATVENNRVFNPAVVAASFGIIVFNNSPFTGTFVTGNYVAGWGTGIYFTNGLPGKYKDNLTFNCTTAFAGGTSVGTND